jgi:hypothetical protein
MLYYEHTSPAEAKYAKALFIAIHRCQALKAIQHYLQLQMYRLEMKHRRHRKGVLEAGMLGNTNRAGQVSATIACDQIHKAN